MLDATKHVVVSSSKILHHFWATFVKRFALCYQTVVCPVCLSVTFVHCGQTVGRIKMKLSTQVGLGPGHIVLDRDPAPPSPNGHIPHPIFGPYLLRPNACMYQDATWYGAKSQPRRLCVRWGPSPPKFSAHVHYSYCDFVGTLHNAQSLLICSSSSFSILCILFLEKV